MSGEMKWFEETARSLCYIRIMHCNGLAYHTVFTVL